MSGDYEVGFGKPPKQHRFQRGNKMARRGKGAGKKTSFTMSEIITKAVTQRRQIKRGDRVVDMQVAEIMIERLIQMATTGTARDVGYILGLIDKHAAHLVAPPTQETHVVYHRAPGSTVELPPRELWEGEEK
jgi:hypothetical protein